MSEFSHTEKLIFATYYAAWAIPSEVNIHGETYRIIDEKVAGHLMAIMLKNAKKIFRDSDELLKFVYEVAEVNKKISQMSLDNFMDFQMDRIISKGSSNGDSVSE